MIIIIILYNSIIDNSIRKIWLFGRLYFSWNNLVLIILASIIIYLLIISITYYVLLISNILRIVLQYYVLRITVLRITVLRITHYFTI